jgi:LCP family protein required for cell wall assembly
MSDGDNATPSHHRASGDDDANQWLTRSSLPSALAAPWERGAKLKSAPHRYADDSSADDQGGGNHTDGVSVAELIAKISGGGNGKHAARSRVDDDPPAETPVQTEVHAEIPLAEPEVPGWLDAPTARIPVVNLTDVPDLTALRRRKAAALLSGRTDGALNAETNGTRNGAADGHTVVLPAVDYEGDEEPYPEDEDDEPQSTGAKPVRKRRHRVAIAGRAAAALVSVVALSATGAAWHWSTSKNDRLNFISALDPDSRDIVDPNAQYGDENFLIVGVDSRFGQNADMGAGNTEDAGGARSDTVMLVNIPANRERVVAVSFPRDLAITPVLCDAWDPDTGKYGPVYDDKTGSYGPAQVYTETKLNSAYSFGGPKCLVKVIQKLSGLSINRFMAIDFAGFSKMVDALGGVRVCSTTPLKDYELGEVLPTAGWQTIDGRTALNYVRARQVTTETNGDYGRIKRQQLFLSSLLRSLISTETFFNLRKLNDVVNTFINDSSVDNVQTKDLVDLGQSIQGMSAGRVTFLTVPTGVTDSEGNEPLRTKDNRALFDAIINDEPLPGENNQNETTSPTTASNSPLASSSAPTSSAPQPANDLVSAVTTEPQDVTVRVSNSTGQDGLASTAANELQQHGFKVLTPEDYPSSMQSTTVLFSSGNEQAAATVASALPNSQMERVPGMGNVVQIVLGQDFNSVGTPRPSGSAVQVHLTHQVRSTPTPLPQDLSVTNAADVSCE